LSRELLELFPGKIPSVPLDAPDFRSKLSGKLGKMPAMENLRTVRTVRRYDPTNTWFQFLWFGLRDGLMEAVKE
jgi:hypothetical protein